MSSSSSGGLLETPNTPRGTPDATAEPVPTTAVELQDALTGPPEARAAPPATLTVESTTRAGFGGRMTLSFLGSMTRGTTRVPEATARAGPTLTVAFRTS